jgi:hypothetical protein
MTFTPYLLVLIGVGLVLAWFAGKAFDQRKTPLALMLAWLSLAFLWAFVDFPIVT